MGFLEGFILGRESFNGNDRNRGSIVSKIIIIVIIYYLYKWLESSIIKNFTPYFNELFLTYILITILIYRYNYGMQGRGLILDIIGIGLTLTNFVICTILGFVIFYKIGGTPFSFLIKHWEVLSWNSYNSYIGAAGEILWFFLTALDVLLKVIGLYIFQRLILIGCKRFKGTNEI